MSKVIKYIKSKNLLNHLPLEIEDIICDFLKDHPLKKEYDEVLKELLNYRFINYNCPACGGLPNFEEGYLCCEEYMNLDEKDTFILEWIDPLDREEEEEE